MPPPRRWEGLAIQRLQSPCREQEQASSCARSSTWVRAGSSGPETPEDRPGERPGPSGPGGVWAEPPRRPLLRAQRRAWCGKANRPRTLPFGPFAICPVLLQLQPWAGGLGPHINRAPGAGRPFPLKVQVWVQGCLWAPVPRSQRAARGQAQTAGGRETPPRVAMRAPRPALLLLLLLDAASAQASE